MFQGSIDPAILSEAEDALTQAKVLASEKKKIFFELFNQKADIICQLQLISDGHNSAEHPPNPSELGFHLRCLSSHQRDGCSCGPFASEQANVIYNIQMASLQPRLDASIDNFHTALKEVEKAKQHLENVKSGRI